MIFAFALCDLFMGFIYIVHIAYFKYSIIDIKLQIGWS